MPKEKIEIGDYVLHENGYIGKVISICDEDEDDYFFQVIDEDSDSVSYAKSNVEFIEKEEAEKSYVIFPNISGDRNASLDVQSNMLRVGCQRVSFETIEQIYKAMKAISEK